MGQMERTKFKKNKERNLNSTFGKKEKRTTKTEEIVARTVLLHLVVLHKILAKMLR